MKRSRINEIMAEADEMIRSFGFVLPPFAYWTPEEFKANADKARALIDARCGWDITDYGAGRFDEMGLFLFTLRNGRLADLQRGWRHVLCGKAIDLAAGSTFAHAYPCDQSRRHYQSRRRDHGDRAFRL